MKELLSAKNKACQNLLKKQSSQGYWFFTLEANESIGAGFIQLMHFLGSVDSRLQQGLVTRMLNQQNPDGSWSLFYEGPSDLSITIECYLSLRLAGHSPHEKTLKQAREFILSKGGLQKVRVFTRIHLAIFGLVPWSACPSMPIWLTLLPLSSGFSIYEFSSWARACIVPLLIVDTIKPVVPISFNLDELFVSEDRSFTLETSKKFLSFENFFIQFDKILKWTEKLSAHPGKKKALKVAEQWVRGHLSRTEDIYPAMAYGAMAIKALGYPTTDPTIQKALDGLKKFQQNSNPPSPPFDKGGLGGFQVHQQCCISPNWDTPWSGTALLESGLEATHPQLLAAARYLLSKEIRSFRGDWKFKNPNAPASGWAFEFQNDYFPDVDDTIQILFFLHGTLLPEKEEVGKKEAIQRGLSWLLSMQSNNGGWGAFDKNNVATWVNKIPFSDHGACQDPPTPDITGRMLELLWKDSKHRPVIKRAVQFIRKTQESFGAWRGRWGVNYLYGTWCVLQGLAAIGEDVHSTAVKKAAQWIVSVQNPDGGWGESCLSDEKNTFVPLKTSVPSQTAWAVMGLVAAGLASSKATQRGVEWLITHQDNSGDWKELHYTGTGFPGHFYLRYHGYGRYFPLLALGRYEKATTSLKKPAD